MNDRFEPAISIIVPVYKAEAYLHRCVDSLLAQTFTKFEVLLIDDGSPDRSGEICDEYATKDNRIRVIHKKNGGVSSARQCGIDNAKGEYTIHADPDDWVEPDMLEELYSKAKEEEADMVICDFYENRSNKQHYVSQHPLSIDAPTVLQQILFQQLHGSCCNKLVKRACYSLYKITFPHSVNLWEDFYINCRLLMQNIRVTYLERAFYHYDQHSNANSIVHTPSLANLQSQQHVIDYLEKLLPIENYAPAFFIMKSATKELAFCAQQSPQFIRNLYSEINTQYIEYRNIVYISHGIKLCIKKYDFAARCLQHLLPIGLWFNQKFRK